ncbi:MAG: DUF72 domain-containing protein [Acidobacteriaceae bacterium]|nr:DUF72 domain-containing protein [Acidobacteriaceae bacterium]
MSRRASVFPQNDQAASPLFCGTSGWAYPTWKPEFYPADVSSKNFLRYYASQLNSLEVNYTFTKALSAKQTEDWLAATSSGFRFSFKAPQRITNWQRLRDCADSVAEFFATLQPFANANKLGCVLFQLPHNFKPNHELLAGFLSLPEFQSHTSAFEFLHADWFSEETYSLLRQHNVALCQSDSEKLTAPQVDTATHRYRRLRQPGGYSAATLDKLAKELAAATQESYVYLRHEEAPTGALQARTLLQAVLQEAA